jgi:hypothetical protein
MAIDSVTRPVRNRRCLRRLLFPVQPRTFPGERWVDIALRSLHLVGVAGIGGGFLWSMDPVQWLPYWHLTIATGGLLSLLYLWSSAAWLLQVKGLTVVLKLVLLGLALALPDWRGTLFVAIIILSGLIAHAPEVVRGFRFDRGGGVGRQGAAAKEPNH